MARPYARLLLCHYRMSPATAHPRAAPSDLVNRRLATGLLLSIVVHGSLLLVQFGVPGVGVPAPSAPQPISVRLTPAEPALPPVAAPSLEALAPLPLPPLPAPPAGMRIVAPASEAPKAPVAQAIKPKRSKPRRISRPLPPRDLVETPTRVIAQDNKLSDFALPMAQPEEAQQQTTDPKAAQDGTDDGVDKQAALLAEAARKEDEERVAMLAADAKAEQERGLARQAEELKLEQQRRADELAARRQADERSAQEQLRRQQADQLAARQQADELALRQRAQEQAALQQAEVARQRTEELARQKVASLQQAEELARRQAEQAARQQAEQAARKLAEQAARQQAEQAARQQAEQVARQLADEAARRQAEQLARQQAEQAAAAGERARALAAAQPGAGATGAGPGGAGAGGSGSTAPKNLLGSDIGNRVRELTRGIDLLKGAPPRVRDDAERGARRLVSGGAEQDVPVRMYVDSFRQKVERNGGLAFAPRAADAVRIEPLVSVALRSDGSVEEVTIVRSSGHADTDNAVRRIIGLNARYSAFPPNIANRYDVIEIRRIWSFAESLRLLEELR
ncbi:TonB C-terminal domain-containing protein [Massilia eurypsychrophila]|nr:TonB C-terminal domain-containing protein [Massilia eurypsychrophila]